MPQLGSAGVGELRVRDPRIRRTGFLRDEPGGLEPFQQARDPGRREQHALGQVDAAQHSAVGIREMQQHLVVVQRQAVLAL